MRTAKLYRYELPIQTGVVLRRKTLSERSGLLVCLQENERIGWGEIAPLPTFSEETLEQAENQAKMWLQAWRNNQQNDELDTLFPSVAFGLSCALAELAGELGEEGIYQSAQLCYGDFAQLIEKLSQSTAQVGKLKIGNSPEKEGEQANFLLAECPHLRLRLDANRQWSLPQAVKFAEKIANAHKPRIQFVEEPCQTPALSRQFAEQTGIAIAWDETGREADFALNAEPNLRALIIKPTLTGSLQKCVRLIAQAHSLGIIVVLSSSLESSLGLTQLARLAQQYTPDSVPGLDTLNLMQHQLLRTWQGSSLPVVGVESEFVREIVL